MATIPSLQTFMSPANTLLMLIILSCLGLVVSVILLISKLVAGKPAPAVHPADAELERRRRAIEVERMELEIQERRQRLASQAQANG